MKATNRLTLLLAGTGLVLSLATAQAAEMVTVDNFARAETDEIFKSYVDAGAFAKLLHSREPTPLDQQNVVRMNRDTLYSFGVFDLDAGPVTVVKPESDRFQSLLPISEDHDVFKPIHEAGEFTFTRDDIGTRYVFLAFRTFADPNDPADLAEANALQDRIEVRQQAAGSFESPDWDEASLAKVRDAIKVLGNTRTDTSPYFGVRENLNPLYHLIGTAVGWGGNPPEGAMYRIDAVEQNDGKVAHAVTVKDVPVDGFWSITVYNKEGYMEPNDKGVNSYNNVTAQKNADGSITINFGGCDDGRPNCIPIMDGWNYGLRQYQPRQEIIDGSWVFPDIVPVQ